MVSSCVALSLFILSFYFTDHSLEGKITMIPKMKLWKILNSHPAESYKT
jgi:hypothetical protein